MRRGFFWVSAKKKLWRTDLGCEVSFINDVLARSIP